MEGRGERSWGEEGEEGERKAFSWEIFVHAGEHSARTMFMGSNILFCCLELYPAARLLVIGRALGSAGPPIEVPIRDARPPRWPPMAEGGGITAPVRGGGAMPGVGLGGREEEGRVGIREEEGRREERRRRKWSNISFEGVQVLTSTVQPVSVIVVVAVTRV